MTASFLTGSALTVTGCGCWLRSTAPDFFLVQPFVNGRAGKSRKLPCQFQVRQPAHEEIIDCARAHAEASGKLALGFKFRQLV